MSSEALIPSSIDQLCQVIDACQHVIPVGNETKAPLSQCGDVARISLKSIRGITQYEPSEFTFTALAGTPVIESPSATVEIGRSPTQAAAKTARAPFWVRSLSTSCRKAGSENGGVGSVCCATAVVLFPKPTSNSARSRMKHLTRFMGKRLWEPWQKAYLRLLANSLGFPSSRPKPPLCPSLVR